MSWKELAISVAIGVVLSVWISCCAPMEVSAPALDGPGLEKPGESGLVVSGSGAEIVAVKMQNAQGRMQNDSDPEPTEAAVVRLGAVQVEPEATKPTEAEPERITKDDLIAAVGAGAGLFGLGQLCLALILWLYKIWG